MSGLTLNSWRYLRMEMVKRIVFISAEKSFPIYPMFALIGYKILVFIIFKKNISHTIREFRYRDPQDS